MAESALQLVVRFPAVLAAPAFVIPALAVVDPPPRWHEALAERLRHAEAEFEANEKREQ